MSRDQELFINEEKSWEKVQGGHPGISPDNMDNGVAGGASPDDGIIELVDVVREGDSLPGTDAAEPSLLFDRKDGPEKEKDFLGREDEDLTEFPLPLNETAEEGHESGLTEPDALHARFKSPDFGFEVPGSFDEAAVEGLSDIPEEDLGEVMAGLMDEVEGEISEPATQAEESPSVSQERLEAIITETVTEVVERVVRETVAEVAERVIKEAIESLRQSLETAPE